MRNCDGQSALAPGELLGGWCLITNPKSLLENLHAVIVTTGHDGVAAPGQMRRGFLAYVERERIHPYRPFLHYNSWFDIAWDKQKYDEVQSMDAIQQFGRQLVQQRGAQMDSFLFDDGWDDDKTLWSSHSGFPQGFTPLKAAAAEYRAGIGVWRSEEH